MIYSNAEHLLNYIKSESGGEVDKRIDDLENALVAKDMLEQVIDGLKTNYEKAMRDLEKKDSEIQQQKSVSTFTTYRKRSGYQDF